MIRRTISTLLPLAAVIFAAPVLAQPQNPAATQDDLLRQVEGVRAEQNKAFQDNVAEYNSKATQAEKDALLRAAEHNALNSTRHLTASRTPTKRTSCGSTT